MRRTLAGFFLLLAFVCLSAATSGWLLKRTAFDANESSQSASLIVREPAIRDEVAKLVAEMTARPLNMETIAIEGVVRGVLGNPRSQPLVQKLVKDAYGRLIGARQNEVRLTGEQLMQLVRNQAVVAMPPVIVPVPRIGFLNTIRIGLGWLVPIAGIAALVLLVLGFAAHPERSALTRSLGIGLIALGLGLGVLGYIVPKFVVPLFTDSPWGKVPGVLAQQHVVMLGLVVGGLIVVGLAVMASAGMIRRQRRWSSPVSTYRYGDQHRWS